MEVRFIRNSHDRILEGHQRLLWPSVGRVSVRSPGGVLFWERCIERLRCFAHNTDKSPVEVISVPTIFMRDPHMRLKRKRLGPATDLRDGRRERAMGRATEAEERDEEDEESPLVRKGKSTATPRKREQAPGSTFASKKTKVCSY